MGFLGHGMLCLNGEHSLPGLSLFQMALSSQEFLMVLMQLPGENSPVLFVLT